jgi:hypothetical protein
MSPETNNSFDIAVLLATRGRTAVLERSVRSVFELATDPHSVQLLLAFDRDDDTGLIFFQQVLKPWLDQQDISYSAMMFDPVGYENLNHYYNGLAKKSDANWLFVWNDDAVMETPGWDRVIQQYSNEFKLLAVHTHRDHPYSIFPIMPRKWYELTEHVSPHPSQDAWLSQQAYILDIWERIPIWVTHDRHDLTGNNQDDTFHKRKILEGDPSNPRDFDSLEMRKMRFRECNILATYLRDVLGKKLTFFENVCLGQQDPWEKMLKNDVNHQIQTNFKETQNV